MKRLKFAAALLLSFTAPAWGQSVQQSGSVTPGHAAAWATNGVLMDAGTALAPKITAFGAYGSGTNICDSDVNPTSTAGLQGYHQLCLGANLNGSGGVITYNAYGNAPQLPLTLIINGVSYGFGGPNWLSVLLDQQFGATPGDLLCRGASSWTALGAGAQGTVLSSNGLTNCPSWTTNSQGEGTGRKITSGASDTATTADQTIVWDSAAASIKTQNIPGCNSGNAWQKLSIKDQEGNAALYYINIIPATGTLEGGASFFITSNKQNLIIQCDGVSDWMVM